MTRITSKILKRSLIILSIICVIVLLSGGFILIYPQTILLIQARYDYSHGKTPGVYLIPNTTLKIKTSIPHESEYMQVNAGPLVLQFATNEVKKVYDFKNCWKLLEGREKKKDNSYA
jgi:hypothetical protein